MSELKTLIQKMAQKNTEINKLKFLTGFDGFIDQLVKVVEKREDVDRFDSVKTMERFSQLLSEASNRSSLREMVIDSVEIGGCAVNMGDGLLSLGGQLSFFGTTGKPMNKAFSDFASRCHSFHPFKCDPGLTMAFEFDDGKYMLSSVSHLA